jgi:hypothetical protein
LAGNSQKSPKNACAPGIPRKISFFYIKLKRKERGEKMAAATMTMKPKTAVEPGIIITAMERIGLRDKVEDLLDEIELQRRLKISEEQDEMGLGATVEELKKRTTEKLKNGYYLR